MGAFPFTTQEWSRVSDIACAMVNASSAEDSVLHASLLEELRETLDTLHTKYGEHPVLLETEADFTQEPLERVALYERAKQVAVAGEWVTYSIRISLARVLLEALVEIERAMHELAACRDEVMACDDDSARREWRELSRECSRFGTDSE